MVRLTCGSILVLFLGVVLGAQLHASELITDRAGEYRVKAAFIYNFMAFTQWPELTGQTLNLCIYGKDHFGEEIDELETKTINRLVIHVSRLASLEKVNGCQVLFISQSEAGQIPGILDKLHELAILTISDNPNAASKGIMINMSLIENKIKFEINLKSARLAKLSISARLLQLASRVYQ